MRNFFHDLLTGTSNMEYEISRVLWLMAVLSYIVFSGWHLHQNGVFEAMNFGLGFGAILAAGGYGTAVKDRAKTAAVKQDQAA